MYCWNCGHKNPSENKFCGACGKMQVRPPVLVEADDLTDNDKTMNPPPPRDLKLSRPSTPTRDTAPVVPPPGTGIVPTPPTPPAPRFVSTNPLIGESRVVREQPLASEAVVEPVKPVPPIRTNSATDQREPLRRTPSTISGPSFLGLSDAAESSSSPDYLLDDEPESSSTFRSYVALALILVLGVLIYKQWDTVSAYGRDMIARVAPTAQPLITDPASDEKTDTATASNNNDPAYRPLEDDAKPQSDNAFTSEAGADAAPAGEKVAADKNTAEPTPDKSVADIDATKSSAASDSTSADPAASSAAKAATAPRADRNGAADEGAETVPVPATPVYDDSQLEAAQRYLQGRGVAQDCNRGVSLLRSAARQPNPKAQIKLGALYATGHCVSQDRAEAYRWFSEAHQLEPGNQWIDKNLNSLWAAMTPEERGRAQR